MPRGRRLVLDLFGTNHDPRLWEAPESFRPERFFGARPGPFAFVPQRGGEAATGHRCPGEAITVTLTAAFLAARARRPGATAPLPDPGLDWGRLPALPLARLTLL